MPGDVLVCGEMAEGGISQTTLELLGIGKNLKDDLGADLSVVLMGDEIGPVAGEIAFFGPDKVWKIDNPLFKDFHPDIWLDALENLCKEMKTSVILMGHTPIWIDVAPRLAFRLNTRLTMDCIELRVDPDGDLLRSKPVFGGNAIAVFKYKEKPQMVTVRPKATEPIGRRSTKGEVLDFDPKIERSSIQTETIKRVKEEAVRLDKADAIVAGGRGLGGPEGFKDLEGLAELLKKRFERVEIGSSRPPVDTGWIPSPHQVGLTGEKVAPDLYIAIGISGAMQHIAGITGAKKIVAINKSPKAYIFKVADYGIVGEYEKVLPAFKDRLEGLL